MNTQTDIIDILIVDDEEPFRRSLTVLLAGYDYAVAEASSGEDAVGLLKSRRVRLVITDMEMPGMSGSSLLSHIKTHYPNVPVLIITGMPDIHGAVECIKAGAEDYILKPVDSDEVMDMVQKLVAKSVDQEAMTQIQPPPAPRMVYQDYVEGY